MAKQKRHTAEQIIAKLERENARLKKLVADQALDKQREAAKGDF